MCLCVLCTHIAFASDIYLLGSLQREATDEVKMQTSKLFHIVKWHGIMDLTTLEFFFIFFGNFYDLGLINYYNDVCPIWDFEKS